MIISEAKKFHLHDKKKYDINNNKELLKWLKDKIKNGYHILMDVDKLQELIDNIVLWYELKYPNREFECNDCAEFMQFKGINSLSEKLTTKQLMFRLPNEQLSLIDCTYRTSRGGIKMMYNHNKEGYKNISFVSVKRKYLKNNDFPWDNDFFSFLVQFDNVTGEIEFNNILKKYVNDKINIDELLILFNEKYDKELDFNELKECVFDYNCDKELRNKILQMAALKLLYSQKTIPEYGYKRAKKMIYEFNDDLGLDLNTIEIDKIAAKYGLLEEIKPKKLCLNRIN